MNDNDELVRQLMQRVISLEAKLAAHERGQHKYRPHAREHASSDQIPVTRVQVLAGVPANFPDGSLVVDYSNTANIRLKVRVNGSTKSVQLT